MKKYIEWGLVCLVIVFAYFALTHKTEVIVSPDSNTPVPVANEPVAILPASFTMEIGGDFGDPVKGQPTVTLWSSQGSDVIMGEATYTWFVPGTDGNLDACDIENKKWVEEGSKENEECTLPVKILPTTRAELIRKIISGELKQIKSNQCENNDLCYEFK